VTLPLLLGFPGKANMIPGMLSKNVGLKLLPMQNPIFIGSVNHHITIT